MSSGQLIDRTCTYVEGGLASRVVPGETTGVMFVPNGGPEISIDALRERAIGQIVPPTPTFQTWPTEDFVVGIPTRFSITSYTMIPGHAGTADGTVQVWAEANPVGVTWDLGEHVLSCAFAGRPYPAYPDSDKEACRYIFHKSTGGKKFTGSVKVTYAVRWKSTLNEAWVILPGQLTAVAPITFQVRGYDGVGK